MFITFNNQHQSIFTMKELFFTLALLVGLISNAYAQKAPVKFGDVNKTDLMVNMFSADTSAPAVILCDYGYFYNQLFQTVRLLRVKILKKEGYNWANRTFNTDSKTAIRGKTYNLVNNEIEETKLKSESIFKTRITDDIYEMRVAMPNVREGSIIDIEFVYSGIPYEWDFQQEIPVVHSELVMQPSRYMKYQKNFFGYEPLIVNTPGRWVAQNMPAFKPEPFMTSSKNFRSRFEFDIEYISFPGSYLSVASTWDAVRDLLLESWYFGDPLRADGYQNSVAKEINAKCKTETEKIKMAYETTQKIKWDETERLYTDKGLLSSVVKEGKGNSAEINLSLIQLLRKLDFNAVPVVLSTRSHGRLSGFKPSYYKLNYVIAGIITGKDTLLLDATEEHGTYDLLPLRALNGMGQCMDKKFTSWVPLECDKKDKQYILYNLTIGNDQKLTGKIGYSKSEYAALDFRNDYDEFNGDEEYLKDYKEGKTGLKVISHQITNLDSLYKPVNEEFELEIKNALNDINGELYLSPLLFEQIKENPFKQADRKYPIDFGYLRDKTIVVTYTIPPGTTILSLPEATTMQLPGDAASFSCKASVSEGIIQIMYKMCLNKKVYYQTEYADLREFYNQVISKEAEPIILKFN